MKCRTVDKKYFVKVTVRVVEVFVVVFSEVAWIQEVLYSAEVSPRILDLLIY